MFCLRMLVVAAAELPLPRARRPWRGPPPTARRSPSLARHVQENAFAPDDRRRAGSLGIGSFQARFSSGPHLNGRPFSPLTPFNGAPPLGPVFRSQGNRAHQGQGQRQRKTFRHEQVLPTLLKTGRDRVRTPPPCFIRLGIIEHFSAWTERCAPSPGLASQLERHHRLAVTNVEPAAY